MSIKKFRLNLAVVYMANPANFQSPIQSIITKLAWLYRLDYAIADGQKIFPELPSNNPCDLIYLRSTEQTSISAKAFKKMVDDMFAQAALFGCVDVFFQLQKSLKGYPFPNDFVRPLNYPYSEVYEDGQKRLYIDSLVLEGLDVKDNDKMLN